MNRDSVGKPLGAPSASFSNWTSHAPAPFAREEHWPREPLDADPLVSSPTEVVIGDSAPGGVDAVAPPASLTDLRDELRRATAEVDATRLRLVREAARAKRATRGDLVMALVPVLDDLDRALATGGAADGPLVQGVEMVRAQLEGVLAEYGFEPVVALGARFDPAEHEAVATIPVARSDQDGVVHDAFSRGYRFDGRVLVPARVRVGRMTSPRRPA